MIDNHPSIKTEGISPEAYIQSIKEDFNRQLVTFRETV